MVPERDTIFALSSGRPPAAIAVVRISGPKAGTAVQALTGKIPEPRRAAFARVRDPVTGGVIDEALALWFPAPASETGEDVAELQLHGGRAVIAAAFKALASIDGLRPAEAGEFTRRAFENGKLDLTAVEGLADLVTAETEGQRRQALRQMQGALRARADGWRDRLIRALALVEARIDFSDEADVPADLRAPVLALARELQNEIAEVLADDRRGERLREGLVVAIAGPPNAGKSTLLNRIARREAAIVSPYAGTTRDVIEVHLDLNGLPVTLLDTAGVRDTSDPVEMEGVRRARERAAAADLVLWVEDASRPEDAPATDQADGRTWLIRNKADLIASTPRNERVGQKVSKDEPDDRFNHSLKNMVNERLTGRTESRIQSLSRNESGAPFNETLKDIVNNGLTQRTESAFGRNEAEFTLSAVTGEGFEPFMAALTAQAEHALAGAEPALITRARQRRALEEALAGLRRACGPAADADDLLAEELRSAARAIERLTGRIDVEDLLDVIFRDFCIGK